MAPADAADFLDALKRRLGADRVLTGAAPMAAYESDALTAFRARPRAVVLVDSAEEVVDVVRLCAAAEVPFLARGSGTSLSGGSLPVHDGVVIAMNRLNRILEVDPVRRTAVVEPGVVNLAVSEAAEPYGLYYSPDPSSQSVCTIGGNLAFNSGGAHCLKYGMTSNHVLGLEVVLPDGEVIELGGDSLEGVGPDLVGLFVGSEGLFGIATKITLRLLPKPETFFTLLAAYDSLAAAGEAVAAVVASGLLPGAMEIMDNLAIEAAEAAVGAGYPLDAEGLLIVELEGEEQQVAAESELLLEVVRRSKPYLEHIASDPDDRMRIWKGRKSAFSAVGRLSPDYIVQDGVVPRSRLGEALTKIQHLGEEHGIRVANVFHAGDGNLHPCLLFDEREPGTTARVLEAGAAIMRVCVEAGGALTGEHGVGFEKNRFMPWLYSETDLENMRRVRGVFGNEGAFNPCKVLPEGTGCGEMAHQQGALAAAGPDAYV